MTNPEEAVADADVVYTDAWSSLGDERKDEERPETFSHYQVSEELMRLAKPRAAFMHCLPAHRGEEVTAEVIDGPRSLVWRQVQNHVAAEQAVLEWLVTHEES